MSNLNLSEELVQKGVFALLVVITPDGEVIPRPIGNPYGSSIHEAILEMEGKHPGCKMKLFEKNYGGRKKYFENVIPPEQML